VDGSRTLVFDIETHSAELIWSMPPKEFVRLIGYKWRGSDEVVLTTDLDELRERITCARWVVGHNINHFDLPAVFGTNSDIPLELTMERRVYDTWVHAALVHPAPFKYVNRFGKDTLGDSPAKMKKWFSLDEQAHQLGVPGKTHDLKALAKEFGGFGSIPVDDPRFREYLIGDVNAAEHVAEALLKKGPLDKYALREQELSARAFVISSNGFRVDQPRAQARVDELAAKRDVIMARLVSEYGFPTEGAAPWATTAGKEAIFAALADAGITKKTRPDWPKTATGSLSLGGEALIDLTKDTPAEDFGQALAELKGQRSLAQLALDSMHPDGFAHPEITMLQRSGRWSTTKPGLTVWTARGPGAVEKAYFIPDTDEEVLLDIDYSNADARFVAGMSGDRAYAKRFEPGQDGHMLNAIAAWGEATVLSDVKHYRQMAKPLGHGWSYGGGYKTLSRQAGVPLVDAKTFCEGMAKNYHGIVQWQERVRKFACFHGFVTNEWGRRLFVEAGREYTQAPALIGQSGTREIVADALLAMPIPILRRVKAQIHDALVFSVPKDDWQWWRDDLADLMSTVFEPAQGGQRIDFPVSAGPAGANWYEASHG
jgi:DNA polymerase-1